MPRDRIMYVELKSGYSDNGPAWIEKVRYSKSGRSVFFRGKELGNIGGSGISGNHVDVETGEEYWVSGVKRMGKTGIGPAGGKVEVDPAIKEEYAKLIGAT